MCRDRHIFFVDNTELLKLFLEYADDLEVADSLGWTPLATAVNRNSKDSIQMLLKRGAKIDCDGANGMDLIATTMSFDDLGKFTLSLLTITALCYIRYCSNADEVWCTSDSSTGC